MMFGAGVLMLGLPNAGRRQFPDAVDVESDGWRSNAVREEAVDFQKKSTQECYDEFPVQIRSSFPLYIRTAGPQVIYAQTSITPPSLSLPFFVSACVFMV